MKIPILLLPIILLFAGCNDKSEEKATQASGAKGKRFPGLTIELPGEQSITLVKIRAGEFMMGVTDPESIVSEITYSPTEKVRLTTDYWLGQTLVTQGQWEAVMGNNPSYNTAAGLSAPVEQITWKEAVDFCQRIDKIARKAGLIPEGYTITLPTEAEWEYAARAGKTTQYWFGKDSSEANQYIWSNRNSRGSSQPVATKPHNPWGLYDMEGNIAEMTCTEGRTDEWKIVKGGSYMSSSRPPSRRGSISILEESTDPYHAHRDRSAEFGLRVALTAVQ